MVADWPYIHVTTLHVLTVCVCVRVRECVRACVRECVCACVCVCLYVSHYHLSCVSIVLSVVDLESYGYFQSDVGVCLSVCSEIV